MTDPPSPHRAPLCSAVAARAEQMVRAAADGDARLADVDEMLTDVVACTMQLETELRRLARAEPSAANRRRGAVARKRVDELVDVAARLRAHRDALAQSPRSVA